jgi:hypothetical protein
MENTIMLKARLKIRRGRKPASTVSVVAARGMSFKRFACARQTEARWKRNLLCRTSVSDVQNQVDIVKKNFFYIEAARMYLANG